MSARLGQAQGPSDAAGRLAAAAIVHRPFPARRCSTGDRAAELDRARGSDTGAAAAMADEVVVRARPRRAEEPCVVALASRPRIPLAIFPTPVHHVRGISRVRRACDGVLVKRDDLTGFAWGRQQGAHSRVPPGRCAVAEGCDTFVVGRRPALQLRRLLAAAAAGHSRIDVVHVCYGDPPRRCGRACLVAECRCSGRVHRFRDRRTSDLRRGRSRPRRMRAEGRRPYVVPRGGATPIGACRFRRRAPPSWSRSWHGRSVTVVVAGGLGRHACRSGRRPASVTLTGSRWSGVGRPARRRIEARSPSVPVRPARGAAGRCRGCASGDGRGPGYGAAMARGGPVGGRVAAAQRIRRSTRVYDAKACCG